MKKFKVNNGIIKKLLILLVWIAIIVLFCVLFYKNDVMVCDSVKDYLASADFKWKWAQIKNEMKLWWTIYEGSKIEKYLILALSK